MECRYNCEFCKVLCGQTLDYSLECSTFHSVRVVTASWLSVITYSISLYTCSLLVNDVMCCPINVLLKCIINAYTAAAIGEGGCMG